VKLDILQNRTCKWSLTYAEIKCANPNVFFFFRLKWRLRWLVTCQFGWIKTRIDFFFDPLPIFKSLLFLRAEVQNSENGGDGVSSWRDFCLLFNVLIVLRYFAFIDKTIQSYDCRRVNLQDWQLQGNISLHNTKSTWRF
jgi:hypothetical protein